MFVMAKCCVVFAARTECFNIILINFCFILSLSEGRAGKALDPCEKIMLFLPPET
jgi:hypothetical protein